ncbi:MAG: response regulator, partial [Chitinophagaceae bacterium]
ATGRLQLGTYINVDNNGKTQRGKNALAGSFVNLSLIPCRARDLLVLSDFSGGSGGFSHTFADLSANNAVQEITPEGAHFWWRVPSGKASVQVAPMRFETAGIAYGAYTKTEKGEMVFGGNHGLVIFNPKDIINSDFNTRLIFTDFKLFNKTADIGHKNSPLERAIDETEKINLAYNQNAITLEFSSVNYTNNANLYRWKLDGLDSEWSPATAEHAANYTNLRPGTYTFRVQWANSGLVSEFAQNERVLHVHISPPIWATTWAYLLYFLIAVGIIYAVIKFYMVQLSENHAKDKIRFFINIVHDIRTPLSLIRSPLNIALKKNDFSENTQSILKTANHNASRLTSLIDQLLDFEKDDFKKIKLNRTSIHAEQTLDKICDDFIPLLEQRGIILTRNHQHQETLLKVDKDKFDKIIFNILSNAVKYTPKGGQIHITTSLINKNFQIDIRDSGVGIPTEQQKYIFKRYFRAKNVINSNEVGFGIGLMVTRELVKLHQGEIWFESNQDQGTTFHVRFPMSEVEYKDQQSLLTPQSNEIIINELPGETQQQKKPKVLIAEDNDELRNLMADHLKHYYQIYHVNNGQQGLATTSKIGPDVIVSDVMMPLMDGNEFCYEIKNNLKTSHIPFILLTALTTNEHKVEGYKIGADTYLEKPFDVDLLRTCIDNLLVSRKKLRERFANANAPLSEGLNELDKKFIEEVVKIVEANLSNSNFSIEELEKEIGMSHASLYRKFKGLLGKTPLEFIQHYRLKKSMELLVSGEHYVNEVAYMVGFSDPKYFSTVFKKFYGKNASDYLKEK